MISKDDMQLLFILIFLFWCVVSALIIGEYAKRDLHGETPVDPNQDFKDKMNPPSEQQGYVRMSTEERSLYVDF